MSVRERERERETETERQRQRERDRQTDRQRQRQRQRDTERDRETDRETERQRHTHRGRETENGDRRCVACCYVFLFLVTLFIVELLVLQKDSPMIIIIKSGVAFSCKREEYCVGVFIPLIKST